MQRLNALRPRRFVVATAATVVLSLFGIVASSSAQGLPPPSQIVPEIDLKCYKIAGGTPLNVNLTLRHLNPVLQSMGLAPENVIVQQPETLCVPVFKNGVPPPPNVLPFVQFMDFVCYAITTTTPFPNVPLRLTHLNRVVVNSGAPIESVILTNPRQLCLPVEKAGAAIPTAVRRLVQFIDLKCYDIVSQIQPPPPPLNLPLRLHHLNPLLAPLPIESVIVQNPRQLCVPVLKILGSQAPQPPADVMNVIRWIDIKMYDFVSVTPIPPPVTLQVRHLNPLFVQRPPETITMVTPVQLGLPVAKNGQFPMP